MIPEEIREKAIKWLQTPYNRRNPKTKVALCKKLHISTDILNIWEKELGNNHDSMDKLIDELAEIDIEAFKKRVYERAMEDRASAKHMELFAKMQGMLIDKSEHKVTIGNDPDELARIDTEAERRTRAFREQNGTKSLQERPLLLSEEVREDS